MAGARRPRGGGLRTGGRDRAGLALFPERGAPRVLWLGLALPAAVFALQGRCEEAALRPASRRRRGRSARTSPSAAGAGDVARPPLPPLEPFVAPARGDVVLYRSDAGSAGVAYTPLATFPLAG